MDLLRWFRPRPQGLEHHLTPPGSSEEEYRRALEHRATPRATGAPFDLEDVPPSSSPEGT